jgi:hypothetical protein
LPTLNAFSIPNFPNFRLGKIDKAVCETPVSVEESEQLSDFVLYPNPASNELFFQYQSKSGTFEAQIFDVSGRLLMTHTFGNQNNATLNISTLKQGFYIINILERNQIIATKRFVKID